MSLWPLLFGASESLDGTATEHGREEEQSVQDVKVCTDVSIHWWIINKWSHHTSIDLIEIPTFVSTLSIFALIRPPLLVTTWDGGAFLQLSFHQCYAKGSRLWKRGALHFPDVGFSFDAILWFFKNDAILGWKYYIWQRALLFWAYLTVSNHNDSKLF